MKKIIKKAIKDRSFFIVVETNGIETFKRIIPYDIYIKALREAKTRYAWMKRINKLGKGACYVLDEGKEESNWKTKKQH